MKARILLVAIMCLCTTVDGYGRTITVDANGSGDYTTIQAAIDDANNADIVQVRPGTYRQTINFLGRNITVTSLDPEDPRVIAATVIDANGLGSVVTFDHNETNQAVLTGFTITGGTGTFAFEAGGIEVYWGAGICCVDSSPAIVRNVIVGNHGPVQMDGNTPLVVSFGGGIVSMAGKPTITRNIIKDNSAYFGAAVAVISGDAKIVSNLIFENSASFGGGAAPIFGGRFLANTIVENTGQLGGGVCLLSDKVIGTGLVSGNIICDSTEGGGLYADANSLGAVWYNNLHDNTPADYVETPDLTGIGGNISADPCFFNAAVRDFTLHAASPCIDTGDPNYVAEPNETDLDGEPRIQNGIVDMGAYEGPTRVFVIEGAPVTVPEGGIEWFHISLALEPNGPVEVTVAYHSGDTDISVLYGSTLYFDSNNYAVPQSVILEAAEDVDYLNETAIIRVTADGFTPADITAIEADNDPVPAVIYVDDDANGANDGSSWNDAFNFLQDALYVVTHTAGEVNDIWVAQGTYKPDQGQHQTLGDRYASFGLLSGVNLYGGFAGFGAPSPDTRDHKMYETILSGNLNEDDEPNFVNNGENSYNVVTGSGTDSTAVIDGFTITAGNANGSSDPNDRGGGMYNHHGSLTVINCTFSGNSADSNGGGMCNGDSNPTITNCTFSGNSASEGGGMCNWDSSSPTITNCTFSGNSASEGGGMCNSSRSPTISNCTFIGNSTLNRGGGMYNHESSPTVTNCIFSGNSASHDGGGMCNFYYSSSTVTNCTFNGNSAGAGGGMHNSRSSLTVTNCTFTDNSAGGAMYVEDANPNLTNCILWGNNPQQIYIYSGSLVLNYCDIQGGWAGIGNIDTDPCFVDPANNDYHLKSEGWSWDIKRNRWMYDDVTSRCIDAGNPGSPLADEPITIPDDPNNIWGQNLRIDMGVYGGTAEASMPPYDWALLADLTNDGVVNLEDFAGQAKDWLESESEQPGDLDRNGTVDINDLAMFVKDWLKQTSWSE